MVEVSEPALSKILSEEPENNELTPEVKGFGTDIRFAKDIIIHPDQPLPEFDKGRIKAYRGTGSNKVAKDLIVYACEKELTPRRSESSKYIKLKQQGLITLVESRKVYWPSFDCEKYCFIYENTLGKRLINKNDRAPKLGWRAEDVITNIAMPMILSLKNMRNVDIIHGEIWPGNLYCHGVPGTDRITLGDCLTTPSSYNLPALYEPVERAIADSINRGMGTTADDIYSFGVSLAVMLRSHDPMPGATDHEILNQKVEKGTYMTLLGKDRLSGATLELLRGLLYDDPIQRWDLEDLDAWMDGRRLSPKQTAKRAKSSRPILVNSKKYVRPELLAKDITDHAEEAVRLIDNGEMGLWIERTIDDKVMKVRIEQTMKEIETYDKTDGYSERACAAVASALYPEIAIHYRNITFQPLGFFRGLTKAYIEKKYLQDYVDVMRNGFIVSCMRLNKTSLSSTLISKFDLCKNFLNQTAINSGLERCIYYLNAEAPCLSPIFDKYYIQTPEEVLLALEDICSKGKPHILFDRHIMSFLSVKDRRNIDAYLTELSSTEPYKRRMGQIKTLATIQKRSQIAACPALVEWMSNNIESIYERFHDIRKIKAIQNQIEKIKKTGDLTKLALLFEDHTLFHLDIDNFYGAMDEYKKLEKERAAIIDRLENKKNYGHRSGQQVASVVSIVIAFVVMLMSAFTLLMKG